MQLLYPNRSDQDPLLLENIVTGGETSCSHFEPESKQQSMSWCSQTSPRPNKSRLLKIQVTVCNKTAWTKEPILMQLLYPNRSDQDPLLLENIVTGDETSCYQFDPESKQQSTSWCSQTSPRPNKSRLQKSKLLFVIKLHGQKSLS